VGWEDAPLTGDGWRSAPLIDQEAPPPPPDSLPLLDDPAPLTDRGQWGDGSVSDDVGEIAGDIKDIGLDVLALTELGLTIGTGAVSGITVAAAGAVAQLFGRDPELVAREVEYYSQEGTYMPRGERGKQLLEDIATPLMQLEEGADDVSWYLSGPVFGGEPNPAAATAIKTTMLASAELLLPSKGSLKALKTGRELRARAAEMKQLAQELGVDIKQSELASSVVELAHKMTPAQRAEHMPYLQEQLKLAADAVKTKRNRLYEEARASRTEPALVFSVLPSQYSKAE